MTPLDRVMLNVWECLPASDRRVLALVANCHALDAELVQGKFVSWEELQTADRVALIRSMRVIGDLAMTCAAVLETARGVLEECAEALPVPQHADAGSFPVISEGRMQSMEATGL